MRFPVPEGHSFVGADRPLELTPFSELQRQLDKKNAAVAREIKELREILSRPRRRRRDD